MTSPGALLLLGGTSDIGGEVALRLAAGRPVVLAARNLDAPRLGELEQHLRNAGATSVHRVRFDATDTGEEKALIRRAEELAGATVDIAVVAFGILGDAARSEHDPDHVRHIATVDYTAQIAMLTALADHLTRLPQGEKPRTIIAFSSIAGWRARRANYVYGSTKAGLDAFCQGLADRLHGSGVQLITARPGFVIGSMTDGMKPAPLSVTPDIVAEAVVNAATSGHPRSRTVWIPGRLVILAWVMKLVPRFIWRKMPR